MSEDKSQKEIEEEVEQALESFQSPSAVLASKEKDNRHRPLSSDEFRSVLQRLDALNLTWTPDIPPLVRSREVGANDFLFSEEYISIQESHPNFPQELGFAIFHALTGSKSSGSFLGTKEEADQKAKAVREFLDTPEFRKEFFFRYAIKVPYFLDLDWEVVIKAAEKNVETMPRIAYALLSLVFRQPTTAITGGKEKETLTVAVDEKLIDRLMSSLSDVKTALVKAQKVATSIRE